MKRWLLGSMLWFGTGCMCVAKGARVRTPRGDRLIEDLEVGDEVMCVDPESGQQHVTTLTATRSAERECIALTFGGRRMLLTSNHPVYCPDRRVWAPAGDWVTGASTRLLAVSPEAVAPVAVAATEAFAGVHLVFDLTVAHELHNFVADGVLVHNKPPLPIGGAGVCHLPNGESARTGDYCSACEPVAPGRIECNPKSGEWACVCEAPFEEGDGGDGGTADGGATDGGTSDGGTSDAGP